jgi:hypothetical protein
MSSTKGHVDYGTSEYAARSQYPLSDVTVNSKIQVYATAAINSKNSTNSTCNYNTSSSSSMNGFEMSATSITVNRISKNNATTFEFDGCCPLDDVNNLNMIHSLVQSLSLGLDCTLLFTHSGNVSRTDEVAVISRIIDGFSDSAVGPCTPATFDMRLSVFEVSNDTNVRDLIAVNSQDCDPMRKVKISSWLQNMRQLQYVDISRAVSHLRDALMRRLYLVEMRNTGRVEGQAIVYNAALLGPVGHVFINVEMNQSLQSSDTTVGRAGNLCCVLLSSADTFTFRCERKVDTMRIIAQDTFVNIVKAEPEDIKFLNSRINVLNNGLLSLSALTRVAQTLRQVYNPPSVMSTNNAQNIHIPYRECLLTRLLKDSFQGNRQTMLLLTLDDDPVTENSLNILKFVASLSNVRTLVRPRKFACRSGRADIAYVDVHLLNRSAAVAKEANSGKQLGDAQGPRPPEEGYNSAFQESSSYLDIDRLAESAGGGGAPTLAPTPAMKEFGAGLETFQRELLALKEFSHGMQEHFLFASHVYTPPTRSFTDNKKGCQQDRTNEDERENVVGKIGTVDVADRMDGQACSFNGAAKDQVRLSGSVFEGLVERGTTPSMDICGNVPDKGVLPTSGPNIPLPLLRPASGRLILTAGLPLLGPSDCTVEVCDFPSIPFDPMVKLPNSSLPVRTAASPSTSMESLPRSEMKLTLSTRNDRIKTSQNFYSTSGSRMNTPQTRIQSAGSQQSQVIRRVARPTVTIVSTSAGLVRSSSSRNNRLMENVDRARRSGSNNSFTSELSSALPSLSSSLKLADLVPVVTASSPKDQIQKASLATASVSRDRVGLVNTAGDRRKGLSASFRHPPTGDDSKVGDILLKEKRSLCLSNTAEHDYATSVNPPTVVEVATTVDGVARTTAAAEQLTTGTLSDMALSGLSPGPGIVVVKKVAAGGTVSPLTKVHRLKSSHFGEMDESEDESLSVADGIFIRHVQLNQVADAFQSLCQGANVNVTNRFGRTAMMIAARNGCTDMLRMLHERGGSLSCRGARGETLLHLAVRNDQLAAVQWLHQAGSLSAAVDLFGQSVVHVAARRLDLDILRYLHIEMNLDFCAEDFDGQTPLQCIPRDSQLHTLPNSCPEARECCRRYILFATGLLGE